MPGKEKFQSERSNKGNCKIRVLKASALKKQKEEVLERGRDKGRRDTNMEENKKKKECE